MLLVSHVDSTIIDEEVIDELAHVVGAGPALRLRVAELAGLPSSAFQQVYSRLTVRPGAR